MKATLKLLMVLTLLSRIAASNSRQLHGEEEELISSEDFKAGMEANEYNLILDVRTQDEWDFGHIENATLALNLGSFGNEGHVGASPSDFSGCKSCTIVIYCRSGARAQNAIHVLEDNGFDGKIYNGQGTNQWIEAGYDLVVGDSFVPPCMTGEEVCTVDNDDNDSSSAQNSIHSIGFKLIVTMVLVVSGL